MSWLALLDALFILLNFHEDRRLSTPFFFSRIDMNEEVRSMAKIMVYDPDTNQIYTDVYKRQITIRSSTATLKLLVTATHPAMIHLSS